MEQHASPGYITDGAVCGSITIIVNVVKDLAKNLEVECQSGSWQREVQASQMCCWWSGRDASELWVKLWSIPGSRAVNPYSQHYRCQEIHTYKGNCQFQGNLQKPNQNQNLVFKFPVTVWYRRNLVSVSANFRGSWLFGLFYYITSDLYFWHSYLSSFSMKTIKFTIAMDNKYRGIK